MTNQPETLSSQELQALVQCQSNLKLAQLQSQVEELKYQNVLLQLRLAHNLSETDSVDINTGIITRNI